MARRRTQRVGGLTACALRGVEHLRGVEEDEIKELQKKIAEMQATAAEKLKLVTEKVKGQERRRSRIADWIKNSCANRAAKSMPESTVSFKFLGPGQAPEMVVTGPMMARVAGQRAAARDVIPLVPLSKFKPTQKTYDVVECFWRHYDQSKDEKAATSACVTELMEKFPGRWASKITLRGSIHGAVHQDAGLASYLRGW